ncbi:MAG: hypothetical protein FWH04_05335 [Oscillospiraceae bacterium]|nr:hypothetical protein [Oscillospiraceae bacterium]
MYKCKKTVSLALALLMCISILPVQGLANNNSTYEGDGFEVEYEIHEDGIDGRYRIEVELKNTGTEVLRNWALGFILPDADEVVARNGNSKVVYGPDDDGYVVFMNPGNKHQMDIAQNGGTMDFALTVTGDPGPPEAFVLREPELVDVTDDVTVTHNKPNLVVTNNDVQPDLSDWYIRLAYDDGINVNDIQQGSFVSQSQEDDSLLFRSLNENTTINVGGSKSMNIGHGIPDGQLDTAAVVVYKAVWGPWDNTPPSPTPEPTPSDPPTPSETPSPTPSPGEGDDDDDPYDPANPIPAHTVVIWEDDLYAWGSNSNGQLGIGTTGGIKTTPVPVPTPANFGDDGWEEVAIGRSHTLAVTSDGKLYAWGRNTEGQLGLGHTNPVTSPAQVVGVTGVDDDEWESVSAGNFHSIGITTDGKIYTWGSNTSGQLGRLVDANNPANKPAQVGSSANWDSVSAGASHTVAVNSDGGLYTWGSNTSNQLGRVPVPSTSPADRPGSVSGGDWVQVSAGGSHTAAVTGEGTLHAWGSNTYGQIGDNSTTSRAAPVTVGKLDDWESVTAGNAHTVALKSDGTLWAWGANDYRQLGYYRANKNSEKRPRNVVTSKLEKGEAKDSDDDNDKSEGDDEEPDDDEWLIVSAGSNHTVAYKNSGSVWTWVCFV